MTKTDKEKRFLFDLEMDRFKELKPYDNVILFRSDYINCIKILDILSKSGFKIMPSLKFLIQ